MLGTKVKCSAYLKKQKMLYVYANDKHIKNQYKEHADQFMIIYEDNIHVLNDDYEFIQDIFDEKEETFEGIIIGKKNVAMSLLAEVAEDCFGNTIDQVKTTKTNYRLCYHVAYRMGGTRLVPIEKTEVIE